MHVASGFLQLDDPAARSAPLDSTFLDVDLPDLISGASGGESASRLRRLGTDMSSIGTSRLHRQRFGSDGVRSPGRGKHLRHRSTTIVKESCGRRVFAKSRADPTLKTFAKEEGVVLVAKGRVVPHYECPRLPPGKTPYSGKRGYFPVGRHETLFHRLPWASA